MTPARPRFLLCKPDHFAVRYVINPWMEGNVGRTDQPLAQRQWRGLRDALAAVADLEIVTPDPDLPDMVFTANAGLVFENRVVLANFHHEQRRPEVPHWERWFREHGFEVLRVPEPLRFEAAGDALFDRGAGFLWAGYGFRTSLETHRFLAEALEVEVVSLRLTDRRHYHLDVSLCPLPGGHLMYYPGAFDSPSLREIEARVPADRRVVVGEGDALRLACNAVPVGDRIFLHSVSPALRAALEARGLRVVACDLSQFHLAGGSARCLSLRLDEPRLAPRRAAHTVVDREVELEGHLINTGLLARALDTVTDNGGSFDILEFRAGQRPEDFSRVRLRVTAPRPPVLESIVGQIKARGAETPIEARDARLVAVDQPGVAPPDFFVTSIYPTEVCVRGQWIPVENRRMDAAIVVQGATAPTARATLLRDLAVGDLVVCGLDGVRVHSSEETSLRREEFAFMSSGVSSERRVEIAVERIAWEMGRIRERGGRIVVVAGPVVIHTGGGPHLAALIRAGYVQALLGGNAIAVHDIEQAVFGTSLGVDLRTGRVVEGGHRHHLRVINEVRRHGGIAQAVAAGLIPGGVMAECVRRGVPFVLAGSIRDDGPLPETLMDLVEAQRQYAEQLRGAEMVLLLASMLHAIGTGNMTPSGVRLICVDISPAVVTKLADRGSLDSVGVVTDVGLFLGLLTERLGIAGPRGEASEGAHPPPDAAKR